MTKLKRKLSHKSTYTDALDSRMLKYHISQVPDSDAFRMRFVTSRTSPYLYGIGSLGNISGGYDRLSDYMHGNYLTDMYHDWMLVGFCMRESIKSFKRQQR